MNNLLGEPNRILLVEDDPNDIELIRLAFSSYSFNTQMDIVNDGEAALRYLLGRREEDTLRPLPRLVLLDLRLPKVNGLRVLQSLRETPRTRKLVVVVMTSSQEDSDLNTCYELGVNSYVVKPLDFDQFNQVARQVGLYWMQTNRPPLLSA